MNDSPRAAATRALAVAGTVAALLVALVFTWYARDVLLLLFAGVLLAVFLRHTALLVSRHSGLAPTLSLALCVTGIVTALAGAFWLQGGTIADEAARLQDELPKAVAHLRERVSTTSLGARVVAQLPDSASALLPDDPDAITRVTGVVSRTFSVLTSAAIILFLGIVLAGEPRPYIAGVLALVPARRVVRLREVLERVGDTLWWWLIGRLISMAFIGVTTTVGLLLLGVPLAFILGLLAALLSFIPNIGPILSVAPALLLGLVDAPRTALWVLLLYGGVQVIETYVMAPIIDRRTVYLPPAVTVAAQLVMALVAGVLGVALATPLLAASVVLVSTLYVEDVLGRCDVGRGSA